MPAQPLDLYRGSVQGDWIDYNGHMNVAYYVLAFDHATDRLLDHLAMGAAYRRATNRTIYVAEAHVTYDREVKAGAPLRVTTQLVDADAKRLHIFHAMFHGEEGWRAATNELMLLHVDISGPRSVAFAAAPLAAVETLRASHAALARPPELGRVIGIRRR